MLSPEGYLAAVLDVDSNRLGSFDEIDRVNLEAICRMVGRVGRESDTA